MLIEVIKFEIHNFETNIGEEFTILNTVENQERVFTHRYTRAIKFTKVFDFEFPKVETIPVEFIDLQIWAMLINSDPDLFAAVADVVEMTKEEKEEIITVGYHNISTDEITTNIVLRQDTPAYLAALGEDKDVDQFWARNSKGVIEYISHGASIEDLEEMLFNYENVAV